MKTLTFAFDASASDQHYVPEGTVVEVAEGIKEIKGFTPVIVTDVKFEYNDQPAKFENVIQYYSNNTFVELQ